MERKADERLTVDVALGAAVGAFGGPVGALEGAAGGVRHKFSNSLHL